VRVLDGDGVEIATLAPGEFFGEFSLLLGTPHQHEVEAAGDVELMIVPKERFDELLAANPALGDAVRAKAQERLAANAPS
jgi:CRP-like cAMP-binding protein